MKRLALLLVACTTLDGCAWLGRFFHGPEPISRLQAWNVHRLGVVKFADGTNQGAGDRVTRIFQATLAASLGSDNVRLASGNDTGLIGVGQALKISRLLDVDALLTGQVVAFDPQPRQGRAWVSVSTRLLEAGRGSIIWSRNTTGHVPLSDLALNAATELAAKELLHDFTAGQATPEGNGDGDRHPGPDRGAR